MANETNPLGAGGGTGAENKKDEVLFGTLVPEEFKDRAYLKDLTGLPVGPDAYNALFKKLDGAEKLIGTKTGVPKDDAPAEEWSQFFDKLRPQTPEGYDYKTKEGVTPDPETVKTVKGLFHKAGLSKKQAAILQEDFNALMEQQTSVQAATQKKLDDEFAELSAKVFGAENEKVLARANAMIKELAPEALKPHIDKLSNDALVVLSGILNKVHERYITEDGGPGGKPGTGAGGAGDLREQARKLLGTAEYKDPFHPKHAEVKAKVDELYKQIGAAQK